MLTYLSFTSGDRMTIISYNQDHDIAHVIFGQGNHIYFTNLNPNIELERMDEADLKSVIQDPELWVGGKPEECTEEEFTE